MNNASFLIDLLMRRHIQRRWLRDESWIEGSIARADFPRRKDRRHNTHEVLELVEIRRSAIARLVQWVQDPGVVWPEAEFVDLVRKVEVCVLQVRRAAELHVSVPARGDVEVALHFVAFEGAVDAAGVGVLPALEAGGFLELFRWVVAHVP